MDMVVFLRDRTGIYMTLEDGQEAETSDLMEIVLQEQGLPPECERIFSLWLVSPLLELRLKKHHRPFSLVQQWDALCATYTDAKVEDIQRDEPVLMFQRNVFYPKELEKEEPNGQILCLLYHEAKFNVIEGRYLLTPDEYHSLASIQALIHLKHFDRKDHVLPQYRSNLQQFYPEHMYRKQVHLTDVLSVFNKNKAAKETCEEVFMTKHQEISREHHGEDINKIVGHLYKQYLEICWRYPFYGSAFFQSETPRPGVRLQFLRSPSYTHIWTAINTEGVCVIDQEKDEILLAVPFTKLSWQLKDSETEDETPCLYLQFLVDGDGPEQITKLLQVYSRQGRMMDALIDSCVKRKLLERQNSVTTGLGNHDFVDGPGDGGFCQKVTNRLDKLTLSTYSTKGEKID